MADFDEGQGWTRIGVAAALSREYASDGKAFVAVLATLLSNALPEATTPIVVGGFLKKKVVTGVRAHLGEFCYELAAGAGGRLQAYRTHIVRGISLKKEPMPVDAWIEEVGDAMEQLMRGNARATAALQHLLGLH